MDEEQKKQRDEMIARANHVVKQAAVEFTGSLTGRVSDLERAIGDNDRREIIEIAYNLESEASTFGWPRVTRLCKWLRKVFSGEYDQTPEAEDVLAALKALKTMVGDPENRDDERDMALFKELYPTLKKVISDI